MADITPLIRADQKIIQSYSPGAFRISGEVFRQPVIITPDRVIQWAAQGAVSSMTEADFAPLLETMPIDVVLLGCGARADILMPALRRRLREQGLVIDVMDTGAACRTYNVLMAEGRRIAAAVLPV